MSSSEVLSPSIEEYLQAICRLSQMPGGVSTTRLARRLSVKPASVTGMLRKLSEMGLITYRRYRNIALTRAGDRHANDLLRRHRLTERLLTDVLGVPLEEAHDEACRLEHAVSPALESRIAEKLGPPEVCPHGNPLDVGADDDTVRLVDAPENLPLVVVRLEDESPEVIRYLSDHGLLPGTPVTVKVREPLDGTVILDVSGRTQTIGPQLAATIGVRQVRSRR
jgi:DtxR family Mn-dependent transcriptional regulator